MRWTLILVLCCAASLQACAAGLTPLRVVRADGVQVVFEAEVARTADARRRGLMGRRILPPRHGMLFDFEHSVSTTMWMKDTPLSLDMLFLDEEGRVLWLRERTTPGSPELISPPLPARYVLEVTGGEAAALGIAVGDLVRGPAVPVLSRSVP